MAKATASKKASPQDWHPADIKAALAKVGWSLNQLSLQHGMSRSCIGKALAGPYPKSERVIAAALGVQPMDIWPSRYDAQGKPNRPRGRKPMRPDNVRPLPAAQSSAGSHPQGNTQRQKAA